MKWIDSHSHLFLKEFEEDIDDVIKRAQEIGIEKIYLPNIDLGTVDRMHQLADTYPGLCFPMLGLHPGSVGEDYEEVLENMFSRADFSKYAAIGEIGIDLYWEKKFIKQQESAFEYQVKLAKEKGLPIVIHARDSFDEIFNIIDKLNDEALFGIFHCFTGTAEQAQRIIDYGDFKMGLGGILTFKNAGLDKAIANFDPQHFVLETDSPYLAPTPHRGKRNERAYLYNVAVRMSEVFNLSLEEVAKITSDNCREIFAL